jgi:CelD/BcsL family acetyltransferase involved in cellulose biosynthesis
MKQRVVTPPLLDCEIVQDFARLEELAEEWQRLWGVDPRAEFFQNFTWVRAWWKAFGEDAQLCTAVVYEAGEVALILPLVLAGNRLRFLGSPENDYADVLCSRADAGRFLAVALRALAADVSEWRECVFEHLRPDSQLVRAWKGLPQALAAPGQQIAEGWEGDVPAY